MKHDDELPSAEQIAANLKKGLEALKQGPEAFHKAFEEMFPPEPDDEDLPTFWYEGDPEPEWARKAREQAPLTPEE